MQRSARKFEEIYHDCFPDLYRFVLVNSRNYADCEEIVQEAFFRLYLNINRVENPRAWLFRCANNLIVDGFRKTHRAAEPVGSVADASPSQELRVGRRETREKLLAALDRLSETQRHCLTLREYGELSYREIADVLGLSPEEVGVHIFRARRRLQQLLEEIKDELS
jgi:RNA polymerase sigma-70 factor (ECF subfamily)